jgi:hypothetical protein
MTDIEQKALALPDRLRIIPDANGMMYDDYDDVMDAADLIEAQAAEIERLRDALERIEVATRNEVRAGDKGYVSRYGIHGIARAALDALGFEIREKSK